MDTSMQIAKASLGNDLLVSIWKGVQSLDREIINTNLNEIDKQFNGNTVLESVVRTISRILEVELKSQLSSYHEVIHDLENIELSDDFTRISSRLMHYLTSSISITDIEAQIYLGTSNHPELIEESISNLERIIKKLPKLNSEPTTDPSIDDLLIYPFNNKKYYLAKLYNSLGLYHQKRGSFSKARKSYQKARSFLKHQPFGVIHAKNMLNLGVIFWYEGRMQQAKEQFSSVTKLDQEYTNSLHVAKALNNLGLLASRDGEMNEALRLYKKAYPIFEKFGDHQSGAVLTNISNILVKQGLYDEAIKNYETSLQIFREDNNRSSQIPVLINLGKLYRSIHRFSDADKVLDEAITLQDTLQEYNSYHLAYYNKIRLEISKENIDGARHQYNLFAEKSHELEPIINLDKSSIQYWLIYSKALVDLHETRPSLKFQAQSQLKWLESQDNIEHYLKMFVYMGLIELEIMELRYRSNDSTIDDDDEFLTRLEDYMEELQYYSEKQNNYEVRIETLILKSKVALINNMFEKAMEHLQNAKDIAMEAGNSYLETRTETESKKISEAIDGVIKKFEQNKDLISKMEQLDMVDYIKMVKEAISRS